MASLDGDTSFDALLAQVAGGAPGGEPLEGGARKRRVRLVPDEQLHAPFSVDFLKSYDAKYFQELHVKKLREKLISCEEAKADEREAIKTVREYYRLYLEPFKVHLLAQLQRRRGALPLEDGEAQWSMVSKVVERYMRRTCAVAQNIKDGNLHPVEDVRRRKLEAAVEAWRITLLNAPLDKLEGAVLEARDQAWRQSFGDDALDDDIYALPDPDDMANRRPEPYRVRYEKQFAALCKRVHTTLIRAKKKINHRAPQDGARAPRRGRAAAAVADAVKAANTKWLGLIGLISVAQDLEFQGDLRDFFFRYSTSFHVGDAHNHITFDPDALAHVAYAYPNIVVKSDEPDFSAVSDDSGGELAREADDSGRELTGEADDYGRELTGEADDYGRELTGEAADDPEGGSPVLPMEAPVGDFFGDPNGGRGSNYEDLLGSGDEMFGPPPGSVIFNDDESSNGEDGHVGGNELPLSSGDPDGGGRRGGGPPAVGVLLPGDGESSSDDELNSDGKPLPGLDSDRFGTNALDPGAFDDIEIGPPEDATQFGDPEWNDLSGVETTGLDI